MSKRCTFHHPVLTVKGQTIKVGQTVDLLVNEGHGTRGRVTASDKINEQAKVYFGTADHKRYEMVLPWSALAIVETETLDPVPQG